MNVLHRLAALFSLLIAFGALAPAALAFDLTGTWEGKWTCQGFDGESFKSSNKESTLLITQTGNTIAASLDNGVFVYNGGAISDVQNPEKRGEAAFAACPNDNLPLATGESEIIRLKVKVRPETGTGALTGLSIVESEFPDVLTCKYKFKRTSTTDPNLLACTS